MNPSLLSAILASPTPGPTHSSAAPWALASPAAGGDPSGLSFTRALNDARQAAGPANEATRAPAPVREPEGRARADGAERTERGENGSSGESAARAGRAERHERDAARSDNSEGDTPRRSAAPARSNDAARRTPAPAPARRDGGHGAAHAAESGARATRARGTSPAKTEGEGEGEGEVSAPGRPGARRGPGDAEADTPIALAADGAVAARQAASEPGELARAADGRAGAAARATPNDITTASDLLRAAAAPAPAGPASAADGSLVAEGGSAARAHGPVASTRRAGDDGQSPGAIDPGALGLRAILAEATAAMTAASEGGRDRTTTSPAGAAANSSASGLLPAGALTATSGTAATLVAGGVQEASLTASPGSDAFARELGAQISVFVREGVQQARLHLNPQELGPVMVRIQLEGQAAQVHMSADLQPTREALEQALPALASQLSDAGITLAGGGVFERPPQGFAEPEARGDETRQPADAGSGMAERPAGARPAQPAHWSRPRGLVDLIA